MTMSGRPRAVGGYGIAAELYPNLVTTDPAGTNVGSLAIVANTIYLARLPRVAVAKLLSSVDVCIGTAAGNLAIALVTTPDPVVTNSDTSAATFTRVAHTGAVAAAGSSSWQTIPFIDPYTYPPNTNLWVAFGGDNATLTVYRSVPSGITARADGVVLSKASAYSSGIPATITGMGGGDRVVIIKVR